MYGDEYGWVLCTGCWNAIHAEHIKLFREASTFGPVIVGINGDSYNKNKNGQLAVGVEDRRMALSAIRYVQQVVVFEENEPSELILRIRPRYFMKGPDYRNAVLPEQAACDLVGAQILFRSGKYNLSSRSLISRSMAL